MDDLPLTSAEKYDYTHKMKIYKKKMKAIENNSHLTDDEKRKLLAITCEEIKELKKKFIKKLGPRVKYNRAKKKNEDKKLTRNYLDER